MVIKSFGTLQIKLFAIARESLACIINTNKGFNTNMSDTTSLISKIKDNLFIQKNKIYMSSLDIADFFNKNHDIVLKEIINIKNRYELDKKDLSHLGGFLYSRLESNDKPAYWIDLIFFGVLTSPYISKNAIKMKSLIIAEYMAAELELKRKGDLVNMGCNEAPKSVLGPILKDIQEKIEVLGIKIDQFMKVNKKHEATPAEKLYRQMQAEKIKQKVQAEARQKVIDEENKKIYNKKRHKLVYDMGDVVKQEEYERLMKIEKECKNKHTGN